MVTARNCPDLFYFTSEDDEEEMDDKENEREYDKYRSRKEINKQVGGEPVVALRDILEGLVNEGYVKGLKENLVGEYTTRLTCKTCGSCSVSHTKDTIAAFGTPDGQTNFF